MNMSYMEMERERLEKSIEEMEEEKLSWKEGYEILSLVLSVIFVIYTKRYH